MPKSLFIQFVLVLALAAAPALAAVPSTIAYQGTLTDAADVPVEGSVSIEFRLYDAPSGGAPLWSETHALNATAGRFEVVLGETTPLVDTLFAMPLFLGIAVQGDAEMTPRPPLTSAPYAFRARSLLRNTIHVPTDGDAYSNGLALRAALDSIVAPGPGTTNAYVLQLDAGGYFIDQALVLPAWVSLRGAGPNQTEIAGDVPSGALIVAGEGSIVAGLRAINGGAAAASTAGAAVAVLIPDDAHGAAIEDVIAEAFPFDNGQSGIGWRIGVAVHRANGVRLERLQVSPRQGARSIGLLLDNPNGLADEAFDTRVSGLRVGVFEAPANDGVVIRRHHGVRLQDTAIDAVAGDVDGSLVRGLVLESGAIVRAVDSRVQIGTWSAVPGSLTGVWIEGASLAEFEGISVSGSSDACGPGGRLLGIGLRAEASPPPHVQFQAAARISRADINLGSAGCPLVQGVLNEGAPLAVNGLDLSVWGDASGGSVEGLRLLDADGGCAQAPPFGGSELVQVRAKAVGADVAVSTGIRTCVGPVTFDHGLAEAVWQALRVDGNAAGHFDFVARHSRFNGVGTPATGQATSALLTASDLLASFNYSQFEGPVPVVATLDPDTSLRASALCNGYVYGSFQSGPMCPCATAPDCAPTP